MKTAHIKIIYIYCSQFGRKVGYSLHKLHVNVYSPKLSKTTFILGKKPGELIGYMRYSCLPHCQFSAEYLDKYYIKTRKMKFVLIDIYSKNVNLLKEMAVISL